VRAGAALALASGLAGALPACSTEPVASSAAAYHEALTTDGGYPASADACARLPDARVRGDCLLAAMERWQTLEPALCDGLEDPVWADECRFQLAERTRAAGDLAAGLAICETTRFRRSCAWHLVQDEAEAAADEDLPTAEHRIAALSTSAAMPDAPVQFWLVRFREGSARGQVLDEADCAGLRDPRSCEQAVWAWARAMLDELGKRDPTRLCETPAGRRIRNTEGVPAWAPGPISTAAEARWAAERCGAGAPPPPERRHGSPGGAPLGRRR
jgi:hypothetical protein